MSQPTKILMVCLGNICRSPMAEGIMKAKAAQKGISLVVESAGVSSWHEGEEPDYRAQETMLNHGINISDQRSRPFRNVDFDNFDYILVMDYMNYQEIAGMANNEVNKAKVSMILNRENPNITDSIPDPYYEGAHGFEKVYQLLDDACENVLASLLHGSAR